MDDLTKPIETIRSMRSSISAASKDKKKELYSQRSKLNYQMILEKNKNKLFNIET